MGFKLSQSSARLLFAVIGVGLLSACCSAQQQPLSTAPTATPKASTSYCVPVSSSSPAGLPAAAPLSADEPTSAPFDPPPVANAVAPLPSIGFMAFWKELLVAAGAAVARVYAAISPPNVPVSQWAATVQADPCAPIADSAPMSPPQTVPPQTTPTASPASLLPPLVYSPEASPNVMLSPAFNQQPPTNSPSMPPQAASIPSSPASLLPPVSSSVATPTTKLSPTFNPQELEPTSASSQGMAISISALIGVLTLVVLLIALSAILACILVRKSRRRRQYAEVTLPFDSSHNRDTRTLPHHAGIIALPSAATKETPQRFDDRARIPEVQAANTGINAAEKPLRTSRRKNSGALPANDKLDEPPKVAEPSADVVGSGIDLTKRDTIEPKIVKRTTEDGSKGVEVTPSSVEGSRKPIARVETVVRTKSQAKLSKEILNKAVNPQLISAAQEAITRGSVWKNQFISAYEAEFSGTTASVRVFNIQRVRSEGASLAEALIARLRVASTLSHPNIERIHGCFVLSDKNPAYITNAFPSDSLEAQIKRDGPMAPQDAATVLRTLLIALNYLHNSKNIVHGELTLDKIQFSSNGKILLTEVGVQMLALCDHAAWSADSKIAPELRSNPFNLSFAVDLWSMGVICFELISGREFTSVEDALKCQELSQSDPWIVNLMERCLNISASERPSASDLLSAS